MNTGKFGYKRKQENNKKSTVIVPIISTRLSLDAIRVQTLFF